MSEERIAKIIARRGFCSRRAAEEIIKQKRVKVDNQLVTNCALKFKQDILITIDNYKLQITQNPRLWLYHKPKGLITTHHDPQGRKTVFANLPKYLPRVISVGRLDLNSEGLLLLTNSGTIARQLELPANNYYRTYLVRVFGKLTNWQLTKITQGITIDSEIFLPAEVNLKYDYNNTNNWYEITIQEGKNREIRKIFAHFNLTVSRLIRISYGPFKLDTLKVNELKEVSIDSLINKNS